MVVDVPGRCRAQGGDAGIVELSVAQRWLDHHGYRARVWLDQAPEVARHWARRWGLVVGPPLPGGSVSVVLAVRSPDGPAVLKLAAPWSRWSREEAAALRAWGGHGAIRLLATSEDGRVLLLERVSPGTPATGATAAELATVLGRLSRPAGSPDVPPLVDAVRVRFGRARENRHGLVSAAQLCRARRLAVELAERPRGPVVLCHGDLMSRNVLVSHSRGLLAIDPNPCLGQQAYDAAQWAVTESPVAEASRRAVALAAELGIAADDVLRWVRVLAAVEVCLASAARAEASLALARRLDAEWLRAGPDEAVRATPRSG